MVGTPGIGKSTIARALGNVVHVEFDMLRARTGATRSTDPHVEDAVNWRAFTLAVDGARNHLPVVIDSTGISKRLPYLRFALGDFPQLMIRLTSAFAFAPCARKWGSAYSQDQFNHIAKLVMNLPADYDVSIDGRTSGQTADEVRRLASL